MRGLRTLTMGLAVVAIWPSYLGLLAYTARQAPWPRSVGILVSAALTGLAVAVLVHDLLRWLARRAGWAERYLEIPPAVARQLSRAGRFVVVAAAAFLLPVYLLENGLIAPEGRPLATPALSRLLVLVFELAVWGMCVRLLCGRSALLAWLAIDPSAAPGQEPPVSSSASGRWGTVGGSATARVHAGLVWLSRHRHVA